MIAALPDEIFSFVRDSLGEDCEVKPLLGDASTRGYYRISTAAGKRYMLAYYPEAARADVDRFLRAYEAISPSARVPTVHFHCSSAVVQEDVGDQTLFEVLKGNRELGVTLYRGAIDLLATFQAAPAAARRINPPFDVNKFTDELEMSRQYFVEGLAGERSPGIHERLRHIFRRLAIRLTEHPYVLCHRDYHGQNIHILNRTLFMIDYQDMRMGPDTYDLASLLRDRGIAGVLGRETEGSLVEYYRVRVGATPALHERYLETLLQRSIKVLGTFAYQTVVRKRNHYLDYIGPALQSVRFSLEGLPQYAELRDIFPLRFEPLPQEGLHET